MKNTLLLIAFLFCLQYCSAQPYQSLFGSTSTSWTITWSNLPGTAKDSVFFEKDTLANGLSYKKVVTNNSGIFSGGLIREDLNAGLVYYKGLPGWQTTPSLSDTEEVILFRYDLNIGDTFRTDIYVGFGSIGVDTVDSVKLIDNRKYIYFRSKRWNGEPFTMIEGIGSNLGVICKHTNVNANMQAQYLLCSYKDNIQTSFRNRLYEGDCSPYLSIKNIEAKDGITIYPNPATDKVSISNKSSKKLDAATLYASDGHIIGIYKNNFDNINISVFPNGLYFIRLDFESDQTLISTFSIAR